MGVLIRRSLLLFILLALVLMPATVGSSCVYPRDATDSRAKTPGYMLFTGRVEGLRVSFEYPERWQRESIEKYYTLIVVQFVPQELDSADVRSWVSVRSDVNASNDGDYINADELFRHRLDIASTLPEVQILSCTKVWLGQVEAQELTYSYRFKGTEAHYGITFDEIVTRRYLAADYKGRIYDIDLFVDADRYENVREGFEHLIATFRFLE